MYTRYARTARTLSVLTRGLRSPQYVKYTLLPVALSFDRPLFRHRFPRPCVRPGGEERVTAPFCSPAAANRISPIRRGAGEQLARRSVSNGGVSVRGQFRAARPYLVPRAGDLACPAVKKQQLEGGAKPSRKLWVSFGTGCRPPPHQMIQFLFLFIGVCSAATHYVESTAQNHLFPNLLLSL